jgi:hypothetical protein
MVIGAILPPRFQADAELIECAKEVGFFYSFLNTASHAPYDENRIKEALRDWRYYGPDEKRPAWIAGRG